MLRRLRRILIVTLALLAGYVAIQVYDIHRVGHLNRDRNADCIIVLGAAAWHDKPSPVLRERLNHAINLYQQNKSQKLLLTGGFGKGADFAESQVSLNYCLSKGIPRENIRLETLSLSTIDNLRNAKRIMDHENWQTALLVSDPWHLKRARKMAKDLDIQVFATATPTTRFRSTSSKTKFIYKEFLHFHHYLLTGE